MTKRPKLALSDKIVTSRSEARASGLSHYFTGKPCIRGHVEIRSVTDKKCLACMRVRAKSAYHADPEAARERRYAWRRCNPETRKDIDKRSYDKRRTAILLQKKEYMATTREARRGYREKYYSENREMVLRQVREYRRTHKEIVRESLKRWARNNPDKALACRQTRRARLRGAEGRHSGADLATIRRAQNGKCAYCRTKLGRGAHLDHIIPLARGGSNWPANLQWLCATCNTMKHAKDPIKFAQSQGLLL